MSPSSSHKSLSDPTSKQVPMIIAQCQQDTTCPSWDPQCCIDSTFHLVTSTGRPAQNLSHPNCKYSTGVGIMEVQSVVHTKPYTVLRHILIWPCKPQGGKSTHCLNSLLIKQAINSLKLVLSAARNSFPIAHFKQLIKLLALPAFCFGCSVLEMCLQVFSEMHGSSLTLVLLYLVVLVTLV